MANPQHSAVDVQIGVVLPQTELGADPANLRRYAVSVAERGFRHLLAYDHVVGADPAVHPGWTGPYDVASNFYEPMVLFGYLASIVDIGLVSGIVILPQRQTVLLAKQAAVVDVLSGGRLRLGVGLGWNRVEYEALGKDFTDRGRRADEQVVLLRQLWTERSVEFDGKFEQVHGAGIAPLPVQRPIPVWFGAHSEPALRRVGRLGDGWFPQRVLPGDGLEGALATIAAAAESVGRDPAAITMEARVKADPRNPATTADEVRRWADCGASHVSIDTMRLGLAGVDAHLELLDQVATLLGLEG